MVKEYLKEMLSEFEHFTDSKTVLGEPVRTGSVTLVPVVSLKIGLGSCQSEDMNNGGGGGGVSVDPLAVVVINDSGVSVYSFKRRDTLEKLTEMVPELSQLWEKGSYGNM